MHVLRVIDGFAPSLDRAALLDDRWFTQLSTDRVARSVDDDLR